MNIEFLKS
jgi:hypothetical protein